LVGHEEPQADFQEEALPKVNRLREAPGASSAHFLRERVTDQLSRDEIGLDAVISPKVDLVNPLVALGDLAEL